MHEIDSENGDDFDHLAAELAQEETYTDMHEDAKEFVTIDPGHGVEPFIQKRILQPISDCVNGSVRAVQKYLETSPEEDDSYLRVG